jgi:hypothetical protein
MASTIAAGTTSGTAIAIAGDTSGVLQLQTNGTTAAVTIDTSQNVLAGGTTAIDGGVGLQVGGTSTGSTKSTFQLLGNNNSFIQFGNGLSGASRYLGWVQYNYASNYMTFATDSTERMRIDSSGNLLVGTTNTNPIVSGAVGNVFMGGSGFRIAQTSGASYIGINSASGTTLQFYTYSGGLSTAGAITSSGTTTSYGTSSDYRLKENITPLTNALNKVTQLKPVSFTWTGDKRNDTGFIAHELQEVMPNAVYGEKDAVDNEGNPIYQNVDTSFLVATLTAAIQELNAKVEAQAVRIAELEGAK